MNVVDVALVVVRLLIGCWLLASVPRLRPHASPPGAGSGVSVVVPARNEGSTIATLLGTLPDGVEVVVVDDSSDDDTAEVARRCGARVLTAGPLPDGWTGKAWACARGAAATGGAALVFVDADVRFADGGLPAVVAGLRRHGGLLSVQPFHEPGRPVESLASLFNVVAFAGTDAGSPLGRSRGVRGAFGPVLATARADYERTGGHEAVRSSVLDDIALSDRYRAVGLPVTIRAGGRAVRFRMYPGGLGQLVEGFTKNVVAGADAVRRTTTALLGVWVTLLVQAAVAPVLALVVGDGLLDAAVLYLVVALQYWWMARRLGRFGPLTALAFPASLALFLAVFVRSARRRAAGSVSWRGREVPTQPPDGTRR